ncbi:MAG: hypothetical protein LBR83_03790 [Clostridiales bacterium]|jgi:hypothetical protein|nr:hypothetical protein [Clostridiales bacterium]
MKSLRTFRASSADTGEALFNVTGNCLIPAFRFEANGTRKVQFPMTNCGKQAAEPLCTVTGNCLIPAFRFEANGTRKVQFPMTNCGKQAAGPLCNVTALLFLGGIL